MKTIHIDREGTKARKLIKEIYKKFLKDDDSFHFFYEPQLIIRTENHKKITDWLYEQEILYKVYDYPKGIGDEANFCYECTPYVLENLELFKSLYHAHSVLSLTLSKNEYESYMGKLFHTACNTGGLSYRDEGLYLIEIGMGQLQINNFIYLMNNPSMWKRNIK